MCFYCFDGATIYHAIVQFGNCLCASSGIGHFHKAKTTGAAGFPIGNHLGGFYFTIRGKKAVQVFIGNTET